MKYCTLKYAKTYAEGKIVEGFHNFFESYPKQKSKMKSVPKIVWQPKGVYVAGWAVYDDNTIILNKDYLHSKDWEAFLDEVPLHELAHLIGYKCFKEDGHGPIWKRICHFFGLEGNRCHNFSTPEDIKIIHRKRKTYTVHCDCREIQFSSVRYNRLLKGEKYYCTHCHGEIHV